MEKRTTGQEEEEECTTEEGERTADAFFQEAADFRVVDLSLEARRHSKTRRRPSSRYSHTHPPPCANRIEWIGWRSGRGRSTSSSRTACSSRRSRRRRPPRPPAAGRPPPARRRAGRGEPPY